MVSFPGEYFVVGIDIEQYDPENPTKYMSGLLRDDIEPVALVAFRSYICVIPSSPVGYQNFTALVNEYMEKPPFRFPNPLKHFGKAKSVRGNIFVTNDKLITVSV